MNSDDIIRPVRAWVEQLVVAERLCPFARRPLEAGAVRFVATNATGEAGLLEALTVEAHHLLEHPDIETTLLIHPHALGEFSTYNQFLDEVDALLRHLEVEGVIQVASFHPNYQFAGTDPEDAENYSNRSPYPLLHLIREESIDAAVAAYDQIEEIPERNIAHLKHIGASTLARRLAACFQDSNGPIH